MCLFLAPCDPAGLSRLRVFLMFDGMFYTARRARGDADAFSPFWNTAFSFRVLLLVSSCAGVRTPSETLVPVLCVVE